MTSNKLPLRVLITAIGGGGHGDQILKALKLAPSDRYIIYGADANPNCAQFEQVSEYVVLPRASDPGYMDALLAACRKFNVDALFHGCEPELLKMSDAREQISSAGIFLPLNPPDVISTCLDKALLSRKLDELGFNPLKYIEISDYDALENVDFFPAVVKPSVGGGGSANCYIVQSKAELMGLSQLLHLGQEGQRFLVQEYAGVPEQEFTVGILHDLNGNYINGIAIKRALDSQLNVRLRVPNRTGRPEFGPQLVISTGVSHGHVDRYENVIAQCRDIASALGSKGPLNIQCRLVDSKVRVFEINPRFSGTTSIRAMMGFNEPDLLMRIHLLGEKIAQDFDYDSGWVIRTLEETRLYPANNVNAGPKTGRKFIN